MKLLKGRRNPGCGKAWAGGWVLPLGAGPAALPPPGRCPRSGQEPARGALGAGAAAAAGGSARRPARPGGDGESGVCGGVRRVWD